MKKIVSILAVLLLTLSCCAYSESGMTIKTYSDIESFESFGNVMLDHSCADFMDLGFEYGDIVIVSFYGYMMDVPFCSSFSDVDVGSEVLVAKEGNDNLILAINMGDFATTYGIAEKETFEDMSCEWHYVTEDGGPVEFTITLETPGGYLGQYLLHRQDISYERDDYPELNDEEYANFRAVATTGMGENRLYRSSSPVDPKIARNKYANAAMEKYGIATTMNLTDSAGSVREYEGYAESYYATANTIELNMSVDILGTDFGTSLVEGIRFFLKNRGPYLICCIEGKDRTGFVCAVLECLMGATFEEVCDDYMLSCVYLNGITSDDERYDPILESNIVTVLAQAFGVDDIKNADLAAGAESYLLSNGLTTDEIQALKDKLK